MPQPNGYRKALRFMKHANQFGFPILTFVDTPGAFAGKSAEELGQVRSWLHAFVQRDRWKPLGYPLSLDPRTLLARAFCAISAGIGPRRLLPWGRP